MREIYVYETEALVRFLKKYKGAEKSILSNYIGYCPDTNTFYVTDGKPIDKRFLRRLINEARMEGHPIVGCCSGYYMADCKEEIKHAYDRLHGSGMELINAANSIGGIDLYDYWGIE